MADLPVPIVSRNSTRTTVGNGASSARPMLVLHEAPLDEIHSDYSWQVEPSDTMLRYDFDESPATWAAALDKAVCLHAVDSMPVKQRSNARTHLPYIVPTGNISLANESGFPIPVEITELLSSIVDAVLVSKTERISSWRHRSRYLTPETPVAERIDELILEEHGHEDLLLDRQQQAEWLKQVMASHWSPPLPQPFIGFDLDDGLFIASWQSDSECNTLTIDAKEHKGWYDPWPASESDNPMPGEIDLETEEAWERLRSALTITRP